MKWERIGPHVIEGEHGYRISKSIVGGEARYRASHTGSFSGGPVPSLDAAKAQVEQHQQEAA